MKVKRFQRWRKVTYGDETKFKFWSPKTKIEGDKSSKNGSPISSWAKAVLLEPTVRPGGSFETTFSMGFSDAFGNTKVSSVTRKVNEGLFGMRIGPEDCEFFIVSNNEEVGLETIDCVDVNDSDPGISKLCLY